MSLNNISLNPALLVDLFGDNLVELTENKQVTQPMEYVGNNLKNVLVLFNNNSKNMPESDFAFLKSIINACKLTISDVAILNLQANGTFTYTSLYEIFESKVVLLFDIEPLSIDLPFNFPHFQVQQFDGCTYLSSPSLGLYHEDKVLKTKLWTCLKSLFNI